MEDEEHMEGIFQQPAEYKKIGVRGWGVLTGGR